MGWTQRILLRWFATSLGLWVADRLLSGISLDESIWTLLIVGLVLSLINSVIKPVVMLLSLPAIVLTLGLAIIMVNGLMVWLAAWLVDALGLGTFQVASFGTAVLAGLFIGLVNYLITILLDQRR